VTARHLGVLALAAACAGSPPAPSPVTTAGTIAIANLDHQIAQAGDDAAAIELLLVRARLLADDAALDRAVAAAEAAGTSGAGLLARARTRAAVHDFAAALADVEAAALAGADPTAVAALRASILVAVGRAPEALAALTSATADRPGPATYAALAGAEAALGRVADADRHYAAALAGLDTTSPIPHAWLELARGQMWIEAAGDPARGERHLRAALARLPQLVPAGIALAELDAARGARAAAIARLEPIAAASDEPEAHALLGGLYLAADDPRAAPALARAHVRFEALLARHPLAFADHAAELYLGAGGNPARALGLALRNLGNRPTPRAGALVVAAAIAVARSPLLH
jgi:hypothetical protein